MTHPFRRPGRLVALGAGTAIGVAALAAPASAHVHLDPSTAAPGAYPTLTFKVPNESETASTTKIEVTFPTSSPFGSVSYQPVPGWKAALTNGKLPKPITTDDGTVTEAPTKITWTATNGGIKPGEFQTFPISAGPLPSGGTLRMNTTQTYSDGHVVQWDQIQKGSAEPEHPAPVLTVSGATSGTSTGAPGTTSAADSSDSRSTGTDSTSLWLGAGGIVLGAIALVTAVWAATRRR